MREADWSEIARPSRLLQELKVRRPSEARKFRLVGVACCRRIWDLLDGPARLAVDGLERFADGRITPDEMALLARAAIVASWDHAEDDRGHHAAEAVVEAVAWEDEHQRRPQGPVINLITRVSGATYHAAYARAASLHPGGRDAGWQRAILDEEAAQAGLVREVFGNVFRPAGFDPAWRTSRVEELARAIDESADFDGLPALGDALEEAGCDRPDLLDHCRQAGPHVRGCWALDLARGRDADRPG